MSEALCFIGSLALTVASVILIGNVDGTFANGITFFSAMGIFSCAVTLFCVLFSISLSAAYDFEEKIERKREEAKRIERMMRAAGIEKNEKGNK